MQCILSTHFRLEVLGFRFRLNLIVVRLANGLPWAGKVLPFSFFFKFGLLCRYSVDDRIRLFKRNFGLYSVTGRLFLGCIRRYVVAFVAVFSIRYGLLLSKLRQFGLIYYTSLDS